MRCEGGGTQAEGAEWNAGDRGEGEDAKEREGAGAEQGQAAIERGGHGQQRVGDDPEAERHPVRDRGNAPVSRVPGPGLQEAQGNPGESQLLRSRHGWDSHGFCRSPKDPAREAAVPTCSSRGRSLRVACTLPTPHPPHAHHSVAAA